jgi:hypothetical protein
VPLVVIWPGHIEGGRRIADQVSMIDVMPTILELCGLPAAEVAQGRSLVPLLRGEALEPRPVILDEFRVDEPTGAYVGNLDVVDGKWGASLEIGPVPDGADPTRGDTTSPPVGGGARPPVHSRSSAAPPLRSRERSLRDEGRERRASGSGRQVPVAPRGALEGRTRPSRSATCRVARAGHARAARAAQVAGYVQ